jgi:hypothetical protein
LDDFCFRRKRIEKRHFDYARNSYHDEFIDFPPHTFSHASSHFFNGPNHRLYDFGLGQNSFVPRCCGYGPHSHRGDCAPCRYCFPVGGSHTRLEPRHLDGPHFHHHGLCPARSNGEAQKTVKTSSGRMV